MYHYKLPIKEISQVDVNSIISRYVDLSSQNVLYLYCPLDSSTQTIFFAVTPVWEFGFHSRENHSPIDLFPVLKKSIHSLILSNSLAIDEAKAGALLLSILHTFQQISVFI
jgi:hypothetical protein